MIERPAATVITPVSFDHPEFLGATVDKIAYEKAGILRRDAPAIIAAQEDAAMRVIEREALRVGAPRIVENFLDMAHFGFVHEGILGDRSRTGVRDYEVAPFDDGHGGTGILATRCWA